MEVVIGFIVLGICAAVGFLTALFCSSLGARRGPRGQRIFVGVVTGVCAVLLGLLAARFVSPLFGLAGAGVFAAGGYIALKRFANRPVSGIDYVEDICELVREHGLANFDALDTDGDGIIMREDLKLGKFAGIDRDSEREVISHMHKHIDRIGHPVGARAKTYESDSESTAGARRVVLTCHSNVFGISRQDLESYPRRARKLQAKKTSFDGKPASAA